MTKRLLRHSTRSRLVRSRLPLPFPPNHPSARARAPHSLSGHGEPKPRGLQVRRLRLFPRPHVLALWRPGVVRPPRRPGARRPSPFSPRPPSDQPAPSPVRPLQYKKELFPPLEKTVQNLPSDKASIQAYLQAEIAARRAARGEGGEEPKAVQTPPAEEPPKRLV
jgi:hypothetical protein